MTGSKALSRRSAGKMRTAGKKVVTGVTVSGLVALGSVASIMVAGPTASAGAASEGAGPNGSFYDVPTSVTGDTHGELLYYQTTSSSELKDTTGYDIAYVSEDVNGNPLVVTGSLWIPTTAWTGSGPRPIVTDAVGTQGLAPQCAPSKQLAGGTEYDAVDMNKFLGNGDAVVVTDYQWSGTTDTPPSAYMVGLDAAHDVLDAVNAAYQVPGTGLSSDAPVVISGYSEGGQAAIGAGELWKSYDPSINLVGDAAGGVPGDLLTMAANLNGGIFAGFMYDVIGSFHYQYPSLPFTSLINSAGESLLKTMLGQCVVGELITGSDRNVDNLTNGSLTLSQVEEEGNWTADIEANSVAQTANSDFPVAIPVPVFNYRGDIDEIVGTGVEDQVYANLCASGTQVEAKTYPGEHLLTDFEATSSVATFVNTVTTGGKTTDSCTTNSSSL